MPETIPFKIIQQWQAYGKPHPKLLDDDSFRKAKDIGITSLQSYVYWAEIEKDRDKIDFFSYDHLVDKIVKHGMRWTPFLILGPDCSVPDWFHGSKDCVYARCLEHNVDSRIQSIWNPYIKNYITEFFNNFSNHYTSQDLFEGIQLGISGNWGEAIYPITGGFLSYSKPFHTHAGWWCGDIFAKESYINYLKNKYIDINNISKTYNSGIKKWDDICFPDIKVNDFSKLLQRVRHSIGRRFSENYIELNYIGFPYREKKDDIAGYQRWLDFVEFYHNAMTDYAEFWIKIARSFFTDIPLYLCTGGLGDAMAGASLSKQVKMVAKYNGGIRITNQTDRYGQSFSVTSLIASASRFYGAYFNTEEIIEDTLNGTIMRIFDSLGSGADGMYSKGLIGTDYGIGIDRIGRRNFNDYKIGEITPSGKALLKYKSYLRQEKPIVEVGMLFPNTSGYIDPAVLKYAYDNLIQLRRFIPIEFIDEYMIFDGALSSYKVFITFHNQYLYDELNEKIKVFEGNGGVWLCVKRWNDVLKILKLGKASFNGVYYANLVDKKIYYNESKRVRYNNGIAVEPKSIKVVYDEW